MSVRNPAARWFFPAAAILLVSMAALQVRSVIPETATYDEGNQLVSGYGFLRTGQYTHGLEHPPLAKILFALPLLGLDDPVPPMYSPDRAHDDSMALGSFFLYAGETPADTLLLRGRIVAIALCSLLGLAIAGWTRRWFSPAAALIALFFFAFDPNFLAHGRYIKNDVPLVLFFFAAAASWGEYLERGRRRDLLAAGLLAGLAFATKFSALLLLPVFIAMALLRNRRGWRPMAASLAAAGAIAFLAVWACYGFDTESLCEFGPFRAAGPQGGSGACRFVPVPAPALWSGLKRASYKSPAAPAYPVTLPPDKLWRLPFLALLVKTPVSTLVLLACAILVAAARVRSWRVRELLAQIRTMDFKWFVVTVPPLIYFAAAVAAGGINGGIRHLLPIFPFALAFAAGVLWDGGAPRIRRWGRCAVAAAAIGLFVESAAIYPHYLAFFNAVSGGPARGPRYLIDSNGDWGQDLKYLRTWLAQRHVSDACIVYYGAADPGYYRIPHRPMADPSQLNCVLAISATRLFELGSPYRALTAREPEARIGYSIYIYDLRR